MDAAPALIPTEIDIIQCMNMV